MNSPSKLLVVDDDPELRELTHAYLMKNGFIVNTVDSSLSMDQFLATNDVDLLILDLMLPGEHGLAIAKRLKKKKDLPIIIVSAQGEDIDRIVGLEIGADDYLPKPFEPKELLLRINAILRRMPEQIETDRLPKLIFLGRARYDVKKGELWQEDLHIRLTGTEALLMRIFAKSVGKPVSRAELVAEMGRDQTQAQDRAIDVQITRLRRKIEANPKEPRYIQTVRGSGYMLTSD